MQKHSIATVIPVRDGATGTTLTTGAANRQVLIRALQLDRDQEISTRCLAASTQASVIHARIEHD
jgi:hypothetical protein